MEHWVHATLAYGGLGNERCYGRPCDRGTDVGCGREFRVVKLAARARHHRHIRQYKTQRQFDMQLQHVTRLCNIGHLTEDVALMMACASVMPVSTL